MNLTSSHSPDCKKDKELGQEQKRKQEAEEEAEKDDSWTQESRRTVRQTNEQVKQRATTMTMMMLGGPGQASKYVCCMLFLCDSGASTPLAPPMCAMFMSQEILRLSMAQGHVTQIKRQSCQPPAAKESKRKHTASNT